MTQGLNTGQMLYNGTYRIEKVLGQGGFGITYLATDIKLHRYVAIKEFFAKNFCGRDETTSNVISYSRSSVDIVNRFKAKFIKEARNIAKFDNPGIIRILTAFEEHATAYYVMEYIEGESLSAMVKRVGPLPVGQALDYIEKVGAALESVHARKINHLDVKPANIMVRADDDTPVLIDFGLSKQYDSEGNQTSTMPVGFSHGYAPMEQYNEGGVKEFSPQTDIYSLAATLYYLLSGVVPPQATKLTDEELTFPASIPVKLAAVISKAMSPGRRKRHSQVSEFISDLRQADIGSDAADSLAAETYPDLYSEPGQDSGPEVYSGADSEPDSYPDLYSGAYSEYYPDPAPESVATESFGHEEERPIGISRKWIFYVAVPVVVLLGLLCWYYIGSGDFTASGSDDSVTAENEASGDNSYEWDGKINNHKYVDLGLPSGLKWATCNVGASTPTDYGDYYAWGETSTKSEYTEKNSLTYRKWPSELRSSGIIDQSGNLKMTHDAANANWGGTWRIPTQTEFQELIDRCDLKWTTQDGHNGYLVTGSNGHSIFLPAAGWRRDHLLIHDGENGCYWRATPNLKHSDRAFSLYFGSSYPGADWYLRSIGRSIRPVSE